MGITGLLPFLKDAQHQVNLRAYSGLTVAVDSYCWLHRGAYACVERLACGQKTDQYILYCMKYVNMLLSYGLKPILVFDGCKLPMKKDEEQKRNERRKNFRDKAAILLREGKRSEARACLERCIDITSEMAHDLMVACRNKGVDYVVAPYEADAQLAYLSKSGIAQIIISEDSDLLLFGCQRVLYKLDLNGNGILIEQSDLNKCNKLTGSYYTFEKFRYMCIMSGCDYLPSLPGIGLGKALKVLRKAKQPDILKVLKKLSTYLNANIDVPDEYITAFDRADKTFLYQLVFDPLKMRLQPLNPYPEDVYPEDLVYAGPKISDERAFEIAVGNINVNTGKVIDNFNPLTFKLPQQKSKSWKKSTVKKANLLSVWDPAYKPLQCIESLTNLSAIKQPSSQGKQVKININVNNISKTMKRKSDESLENLTALYGCKQQKRLRIVPPREVIVEENDTQKQSDENNVEESLENLTATYCGKQQKSIVPPSEVRYVEKKDNQKQCEEHAKESVPLESKEESFISPQQHRNVFATIIHNKGRFDINAKREQPTVVKSRFFAKKLLKQTQMFLDEIKPEPVSKFNNNKEIRQDQDVIVKDGNLEECHILKSDEICTASNEEPVPDAYNFHTPKKLPVTQPRSIGSSNFNWKRLKNSLSNHDSSSSPIICSPACSSQFKQVKLNIGKHSQNDVADSVNYAEYSSLSVSQTGSIVDSVSQSNHLQFYRSQSIKNNNISILSISENLKSTTGNGSQGNEKVLNENPVENRENESSSLVRQNTKNCLLAKSTGTTKLQRGKSKILVQSKRLWSTNISQSKISNFFSKFQNSKGGGKLQST